MLDSSVSDVPLCLTRSNSVFSVVKGFQQFIQYLRSLPQGPINHQLTSCIEHVKDEISHRNIPHQLVTHLLTSQSLLKQMMSRPSSISVYNATTARGSGPTIAATFSFMIRAGMPAECDQLALLFVADHRAEQDRGHRAAPGHWRPRAGRGPRCTDQSARHFLARAIKKEVRGANSPLETGG